MSNPLLIARSSAVGPIYIGIDLGGTNTKLGIVDSKGQTVGYESIPTAAQSDGNEWVSRAASRLDGLLKAREVERREISAIGLATPGTMDISAGIMLAPPNLPWRNFAVRDAMAKATDFPVVFANDANAAAQGEFWVGGGAAYDSIVFLTLGTGVGAGIIVHGRTIDGHHSHGGECGHILIDTGPDARRCGCGQQGHLEAYCSATAIVAQAKLRLSQSDSSSLMDRTAGGQPLSARMIGEEAAAGDPLSNQLIDELATHLGRGMVTIAHTVDPETILIGGSMTFGGRGSTLGEKFLATASETFRQFAFPSLANGTKIEFAALGAHAGYVGAAAVAWRDTHGK